MGICRYETGELSGLDCPCKKCKEVRVTLAGIEKRGKVKLVGTEEDLSKIRKEL